MTCSYARVLHCVGVWAVTHEVVGHGRSEGKLSFLLQMQDKGHTVSAIVHILKDLKAIFTHVDNLDNEYEGREVCRETRRRQERGR